MSKQTPPHVCALLSTLVSRHAYGSPLPKEVVINFAAVPSSELADAKETFDTIRKSPHFPFVNNHGGDFVSLNNSEFGELIEYLYHECGWSEFELRTRFKHYEGWDRHDFPN